MSKVDRSILRWMGQLARVRFAPRDVDRAMDRVRTALAGSGEPRQANPQRRSIMRTIVMPAGIAASVLVAVGVLFWSPSRQTASAVEMLKAVAAAGQAYDGWVHIDIVVPEEAWKEQGFVRSAFHTQPAKGIVAQDGEDASGRQVWWGDVNTRTRLTYSSAGNKLVIDRVHEQNGALDWVPDRVLRTLRSDQKQTIHNLGLSFLMSPSMEIITLLVDNGWCRVSVQPEATYDRYTLTFNAEKLLDPERATETSLVLLVDRQTKRLTRWSRLDAEHRERLAMAYRYGEPELHDIYDLGVPRDAKIVDKTQAFEDPQTWSGSEPGSEAFPAEQAAAAFFQACHDQDWQRVGEFYGPDLTAQAKRYLAGLRVIRLGKAFRKQGYAGWYVPYEIRLQGGEVRGWKLAVRNDNPAGRFMVDGGI